MSDSEQPQVPLAGTQPAGATRYNAPGRPALTYQGGEYVATLRRMLARLAHQEELSRLNPEAVDDWSIALLHVSSIVTDVLTFYQERITNEGYLNTATDERSVLELARSIGYELKPGVAARAYLALTVPPDEKGQPRQATVKRGKAIQSTPAEGQLPQIFEADAEEVTVRTEWNVLRPLAKTGVALPHDQDEVESLPKYLTSLRIAGYRTDIKPGDLLLIVDAAAQEIAPSPPGPSATVADETQNYVLATVKAVDANPSRPYTVLTWGDVQSTGEYVKRPVLYVFSQRTHLYKYLAGSLYFNPEVAPPTPSTVAATGGTTAAAVGGGTGAPGAPVELTVNPAAWAPVTLGLPQSDLFALEANRQGVLFAGTRFDVFRSRDDGASWQRAGVDLVTHAITSLAVSDDGVLFAGSSTGGIYLSRDDGDNWTAMSGDNVPPDASVENQGGKKFKVTYSQVLPKEPVRLLDTSGQGEKLVVYAGTDKGMFRSADEGKTWEGPLVLNADGSLLVAKAQPAAPAAEPPPTPGPAPAGMVAPPVVLPAVAGAASVNWLDKLGKLGATFTGWARKIIHPFAPGIGQPAAAIPIRALGVAPAGKAPAVLVGTDAGKFKLKGETNRWLVFGAILLLAMLMQRCGGGSATAAAGPFAKLDATLTGANGAILLPAVEGGAAGVFTSTALSAHGQLHLDPPVPLDAAQVFSVTLAGDGNFVVAKDAGPQDANGTLTTRGVLQAVAGSAFTSNVTLDTTALLTATGLFDQPAFKEVDGSLAVPLAITATGQFTPTPGQAPLVKLTAVESTGTASAQNTSGLAWLLDLWNQIVAWVKELFVNTQQAVVAFLTALWALVPAPLQAVLQPVYDVVARVLGTIWGWIDAYLIKPLLDNAAVMLAKVAAAGLVVWLAMALWRWLTGRVANSKAVRIEGTVNAIIIRPSGQIVAATSTGLYRSLENQDKALIPERIRRFALRTLLKDRLMQKLASAPAIDFRALAEVGSTGLLAGAADGQLWRSDNNGDTWAPYVQDAQNVQGDPAQPNAHLRGLKSIRAIVVTPRGEFILGDPVGRPSQDQWFTAQFDPQDAQAVQVDLDSFTRIPAASSWLVLSREHTLTPGPVTPARVYYGRYRINTATTVVTPEFSQLGAFVRLAATRVDGPASGLLALPRSTADVWFDSTEVDLFDNRPVEGDRFTCDQVVPGIEEGHNLILAGKAMRVKVADANIGRLEPENRLEPHTLAFGEVLELLAAPEELAPPLIAPATLAPATLTPATLASVPGPAQQPAQPDAASGLRSYRWRLKAQDGSIGTVCARKEQLHWLAPADTDPYVYERVTVAGVSQAAAVSGDASEARTCLTFQKPLAMVYDRATVTLAGNIVPVTHGRTVENVVIGSGNGMQPNEHFTLPEQPLTYLTAPTEQRGVPQLAVAVNEILWERVGALYGQPRDRRGYVVRQESDGTTTITFGDGKQGARLPTGSDQITATYRIGNGELGNVPANTINQPQTFPAAVRTATNPLPASGGAAPEQPESARRRAPRSVRCLGRIVSLLDYEDFAQSFAGIDRAQVAVFDLQRNSVVFLTVAGPRGDPQALGLSQCADLLAAVNHNRAARMPRVVIKPYERLVFNCSARLLITPASIKHVAAIERAAHARLQAAFAFDQRQFAHDITEAAIVAELCQVEHVATLVDVALSIASTPSSAPAPLAALPVAPGARVLAALPARLNPDQSDVLPAQMLVINPLQAGIQLQIATLDAPGHVLNETAVTE